MRKLSLTNFSYFVNGVYEGILLIISLILGFVIKDLTYLYSAILFIPFSFFYIYITNVFSKLVSSANNLSAWRKTSIFFLLSFVKIISVLIPFILTVSLKNFNIFNLWISLSAIIGFTIVTIITQIIYASIHKKTN